MSYITIKEPQFNCRDMDARLRTLLIRHMATPDVTFTFTWRAKDALVKRAKEITPTSIDLLIRMLPGTIAIINAIWHVCSEDVMERIIRHDEWKNAYSIPRCIEDYVWKHGKEILKKYDNVPCMVMILLSQDKDDNYGTDGMQHETVHGELATPGIYVKYMKRIAKYSDHLKSHYLDAVLENAGKMITTGKLIISVPEIKEEKHELQVHDGLQTQVPV